MQTTTDDVTITDIKLEDCRSLEALQASYGIEHAASIRHVPKAKEAHLSHAVRQRRRRYEALVLELVKRYPELRVLHECVVAYLWRGAAYGEDADTDPLGIFGSDMAAMSDDGREVWLT